MSSPFSPTVWLTNLFPTVYSDALQTPSQALYEHTLNSMGVTSARDDEDDICFIIGDEAFRLHGWLLFDGESQSIFNLTCLVEPPIPIKQSTEALIICHEYHRTYRFGRLFLHAPKDDSVVKLRFEIQLDLSNGVTADFLRTTLALNCW